MKTIIIAFLFILSSCRQLDYSVQGFEEYVNEFKIHAAQHNKKVTTEYLSIEFGETTSSGKDVIGLCYTYESEDREIVLNKEYWDAAPELQRKNLIFHELGHCLLGLEHDDSVVPPTMRPKSLMNSHVLQLRWLQSFYDSYIEELFSK